VSLPFRIDGSGYPTVVLEAGLAATSLSWRLVQDQISTFTRVVTYDRAGLGFSEPDPAPPTLARQVDYLRALLRDAGEPPPYVLVAHSFGALIAQSYARRYRDETLGLVLVDPLRPEEWSPLSDEQRRRLERGVKLSRRGAMLARIGVVGWCLRSVLAGSQWLPKTIGAAASGRGLTLMNRLAREVSKLPKELWPIVVEHWSNPKCFLAMAAQLEALPAAADEIRNAPALDIPTVVLTAPNHWIQLDDPQRVAGAVRDLISSLPDKSPGRQ